MSPSADRRFVLAHLCASDLSSVKGSDMIAALPFPAMIAMMATRRG